MKNKLFLLATAIMLGTIISHAQEKNMWIGGSATVWSSKAKGSDAAFSYKIAPEFGYALTKKFSIGTSVGFMQAEAGNDRIKDFGGIEEVNSLGECNGFFIAPFVRYTFLDGNVGFLYVDGGIGYGRLKRKSNDQKYNLFYAGFGPGFGIKISKSCSVVGQLGQLGYTQLKVGDYKSTDFGLDLDWDQFEVGFIFRF
ncbi:MAG: porin family protein [Prevotellaceae bacterium]|jgi:hypothetical protein|nr:porin family protein [Prevotellaceae bacterium]